MTTFPTDNMAEVDSKLLAEQEEGEQFEAGGNGHEHNKEEPETPIADEELRQYQEPTRFQSGEEEEHGKRIPPEVIFDKLKEGVSRATYIQKHSEYDLLAEAVIVGGIPYFAVAQPDTNGEFKITLEKSMPLNETSGYKPYEKESYLNKPYSFTTKEEFETRLQRARNETLNTLYKKVKSIWSKYIDADDFHISICAADTIFTYYQDKIGMTHYLIRHTIGMANIV